MSSYFPFLVLLVCVAHSKGLVEEILKNGGNDLAPIIFLPGYMGNALDVTISDAESVPSSCEGLVPVGTSFKAWYNETIMQSNPQCVYDLLSVDFDAESNIKFVPKPNIKVTVPDFGDWTNIDSGNYESFKKQLLDWGYIFRKNAFGAPYDFRYMSPNTLESIGFIAQMKDLVETSYHRNNKRRAVLVGHSNGGPTMYSFVAAMSQEWKDTYLSAIVGLSGNFLGQMNCVVEYLGVNEGDEGMMVNSWEAQYMSMPWGDYPLVRDIPIVVSRPEPNVVVNYTSTVKDLSALFTHLNHSEWVSRLEAASPYMNRSLHPGVDTCCFYGQKLPTSYSFEYSVDVATEGANFVTHEMNGDSNQDIIDQQFCENVWGTDTSAVAQAHTTVSRGFDGVGHMEMYSDENVLSALYDVLLNAK